MKSNKFILIAVIFSLMLILSSCGEPEPEGECPASCGDNDPCTTDSCSKDTRFMCRNTPIPGCDAACGVPCTGSAGKYMTMQCDTAAKQCAADVSPSTKINPTPLLLEQLTKGFKFRVETLMNQPFNMQADTLGMDISLITLPDGVDAVTIKNIELSGQTASRQTVILARKAIGRTIYGTSSPISEQMRVDFPTSDFDGTFSTLKMTISYEYDQLTYGNLQKKDDTITISVRAQTLEWMKPTVTQSCPSSCDDGNSATDDVCSAATEYFCEHNPKAGVCGNSVCDSTEDKCDCPDDCGPCSGPASSSLSYACSSSNKCVTMISPSITQEPISLFDDRNINIFHLQNNYAYNSPFNVNTDKFTADFSLFNIGSAYKDVKIATVKIMDMDQEIASAEVGKTFSGVGDSVSVEMSVDSFTGTEESKTLSLKVWYEYAQVSGNISTAKFGSYSKGLGKIPLVNPTG